MRARVSASGPLPGLQWRRGGTRLAITSDADERRGPGQNLFGDAAYPRVGGLVDVQRVFRDHCPCFVEQTNRVQKGIVCLVGLDLGLGKITGGNVGPGVPVKPHRLDVQKGWLAVATNVVSGGRSSGEGIVDIEPAAVEVLQSRAAREKLAPIHPLGVFVEIPMPLSSQQNRSGSGTDW